MLVQLLVSLNATNSPIHESGWYPEGDLKIDSERSVIVQHQSRLPPNEVRPYFADWRRMSDWIGGWGVQLIEDADTAWIGVAQDHDFTLTRVSNSSDAIVMAQVWGDRKYRCKVTIDFEQNSNGTLITVTFIGIISIHLEQEYKHDWCLDSLP